MTIDWTKEKINELSLQEIVVLQENARFREKFEVVNWCEEILVVKKPVRKERASSTVKTLEAECSHLLSEFAKQLVSNYDLTPSTAIKRSEGIKGFRPHNLTAKNGQAKLGGDQRTGKVAIDRYISYRVKNETISLTAWLGLSEGVDGLKWQVCAPAIYLQSNKSTGDEESALEEFIEFKEASQKFETLLPHFFKQDI